MGNNINYLNGDTVSRLFTIYSLKSINQAFNKCSWVPSTQQAQCQALEWDVK